MKNIERFLQTVASVVEAHDKEEKAFLYFLLPSLKEEFAEFVKLNFPYGIPQQSDSVMPESKIELPNKLKLYFDGSCMPKNPGGIAGFGWRLLDETGKEIKSASGEVCRGENATNNIAEWAALTYGLQYLFDEKWDGDLKIYGDSQLVIYQLIGKYQVRKSTLVPYYKQCIEYLKNLNWEANWVPREENEECDRLSKRDN